MKTDERPDLVILINEASADPIGCKFMRNDSVRCFVDEDNDIGVQIRTPNICTIVYLDDESGADLIKQIEDALNLRESNKKRIEESL